MPRIIFLPLMRAQNCSKNFCSDAEKFVLYPYKIENNNTVLRKENSQINLPNEITLTAWSINKVTGGKKMEYGDRFLCRILDWDNGVIELSLQKKSGGLTLSEEAIQREEWYTDLENAFLNGFDRYGPCDSIDSQLANVFLENQETLCIKNCGSIEECMMHTSKIGFQPYGEGCSFAGYYRFIFCFST